MDRSANILMGPPIPLLRGLLLQCCALVSVAHLASAPAQRTGAVSSGGYSYSASPCGAASITDEHTTCADAVAALGCTFRFRGPERAGGCLFHDGEHGYSSPIVDGSTDSPTDAYICKTGDAPAERGSP